MGTPRTRSRTPRPEAGAVETGQVTTITDLEGRPVDPADPAGNEPTAIAPKVDLPTSAALTGAEMNMIRSRVELVDKAAAQAKEAQDEARFRNQLAQLAQSELSMQVMNLVRQYGLDQSFEYRLDPDSATLVRVERQAQLTTR